MSWVGMVKTHSVHRLFVGVALLALMVIIRSFVWYKYVPGVIDVWHWTLTYIILLPTDGAISVLYGFWSGEKLMAFLVGFLPSVAAMIVATMRLGSPSGIFIHLLLGVGMGIMGFGGAEYKADRKPLWFVAGFLIWLLILLMAIGAGMD